MGGPAGHRRPVHIPESIGQAAGSLGPPRPNEGHTQCPQDPKDCHDDALQPVFPDGPQPVQKDQITASHPTTEVQIQPRTPVPWAHALHSPTPLIYKLGTGLTIAHSRMGHGGPWVGRPAHGDQGQPIQKMPGGDPRGQPALGLYRLSSHSAFPWLFSPETNYKPGQLGIPVCDTPPPITSDLELRPPGSTNTDVSPSPCLASFNLE